MKLSSISGNCLFMAALTFLACGSTDEGDANDSVAGGAGVGGESAGAAGSSGGNSAGSFNTAGNAAAGNGGSSGGSAGAGSGDVTRLNACVAATPCEDSSAQLIEGFTHNIHTERLVCVLKALGDRVPGRYTHRTDSTFTSGNVVAEHKFVLNVNGVAYARKTTSGGVGAPAGAGSVEGQGARCQLKPKTYFDACLAAVQDEAKNKDLAWRCAFGDGTATLPSNLEWFESCVTESPIKCE
jgi:hypothetical protein